MNTSTKLALVLLILTAINRWGVSFTPAATSDGAMLLFFAVAAVFVIAGDVDRLRDAVRESRRG